MNFLELKTGQKLRILSLYEDRIMDKNNIYWDNHLKRHFKTNNNINVFNNDTISRRIQYVMLVEYEDELRLIKTGQKIQHLINDYDGIGYIMKNLNKHALYLNVVVGDMMGFANYDECTITVEHDNAFDYYFESPIYQDTIKWLNSHYDRNELRKNPFMIEYLNIIGIIDNKNPLMRILKLKKLKNA